MGNVFLKQNDAPNHRKMNPKICLFIEYGIQEITEYEITEFWKKRDRQIWFHNFQSPLTIIW